MAVFRAWSNASGSNWANPSNAYDLTQDDVTTYSNSTLINSHCYYIWKLTDNVSGLTNVTLKIKRKYETSEYLDIDTGESVISSHVGLEYSWDGTNYTLLDSKDGNIDLPKTDTTTESFVIDATGRNLNQLYLRADSTGGTVKRYSEDQGRLITYIAAARQQIYDMYIESATGGVTTGNSVLTLGTITSALAFTTPAGKNAYTFTIPLTLNFTNTTSSGLITAVNGGVTYYQYPPATLGGNITLTNNGALNHTFEMTLTGPTAVNIKIVDSNEVTAVLTHADWSNLEYPFTVNPWNTATKVYCLDAVDNTGKLYAKPSGNMAQYPLIVSSKTAGATHPTNNPLQSKNRMALFSGFIVTNTYWPTTGTPSGNTLNLANTYDEQAATPVNGNEAAAFSTFSTSSSEAFGVNTSQNSWDHTVTMTDVVNFTTGGVFVQTPTIKVVWEASASGNYVTDITTFDEIGGNPIEHMKQDFQSSSSVTLEYSTNSGSTWVPFDNLWANYDIWSNPNQSTPTPFTETKAKGTSTVTLTGSPTLSNIRVRVVQESNAKGVWSYQGSSWQNIVELDASTSVKVYAIYLETPAIMMF